MKKAQKSSSWAKKLGKSFTFNKKQLTHSDSIRTLEHELQHSAKEHELRKQEEVRKKEAEAQRKLIAKDVKKEVEAPEQEAPIVVRKKKQSRKQRSLKELLVIAGIELEPMQVYKRTFLAAVIITLFLTLVTLGVEFFFDQTFASWSTFYPYLGFLAALWTVAFVFILGFCAFVFAVYLDLRINKRRKEIEAVFPDFLQLAAANLSAGMTIDRALWSAIRPRFGVLAKEMEDVAKKTMTGYDLERALHEFSHKYDSVTIRRSINLIIEGIHSGGKLADILNKIAINMQENSILQKEMAANVTTYIIFISFATVGAAPFLFGLSTQLLLVIKSIAGSLSTDTGSGLGLTINPDVIAERDFKIFSFLVLSISSLMSACIVSVIRKGTIKDGLRLLPFFWVISIVLYFVATWGLGLMFSGLV